MKFFTKQELKIVGIILFTISLISFFNFRISIRRARDNQRKNDFGTLQRALEDYSYSVGIVPFSSEDGKILACKDETTYFDEEKKTWVNIKPCEWGEDSLEDFTDSESSVFMNPIPMDPQNLQGVSFVYLSNGKRFQILGHLEGKDEPEYDSTIEARNIMCGSKICNYGRAYDTPLDISIEEYENKLQDKLKKKN